MFKLFTMLYQMPKFKIKMARYKERKKRLHKSDTKEYFLSITSVPKWCEILLANVEKPYNEFIHFLISKNFYHDINERILIKNIAADSGFETTKISKWLPQIYEDIIEFNNNKPELFKTEGIRHEISCSNFDNYIYFTIWLVNTPRVYENFEFNFVRSKVGTYLFYVDNVTHNIEKNEQIISITLKGGFVNKFREMLVDKGDFYGVINILDTLHLRDFEIDEKLKKYYKH